MLSASKLSLFGTNPIVVSERVEIAPHVLFECGGYDSFSAAGSGTLGQPPSPQVNASAACPWPENLYAQSWESHQPPQQCNAALNVCGSNHSADYQASWLVSDYLGQWSFSQCLVGTDGKQIFSTNGNPTDLNKACPSAAAKPWAKPKAPPKTLVA